MVTQQFLSGVILQASSSTWAVAEPLADGPVPRLDPAERSSAERQYVKEGCRMMFM
jgi:hypothetical protein